MAELNNNNNAMENVTPFAELEKGDGLSQVANESASAVAVKKGNSWFKKEFSNWLFMSPFIIGFSVFMLYPLVASLIYSFTDINGAGYMEQFGLMNYKDIFDFTKYGLGQEVWHSFGITGLYAIVSIPLNILLAYSLALALRKNIPGIKVLRLLFYLPVLIPGIVGGQIWCDILAYGSGAASELGIINQWLTDLGLQTQTFFSVEGTQFWTLLVIAQWGIGGGMIVWLAALENVPKTLYEAADIDGANYFVKLFRITLPMSTPIIFYNLIGAVIGSLQMFDSFAYLGAGINNATDFIAIRIYMTAFTGEMNYGLACAQAWMLFIIIGILTVIMFKSSSWVFYGDSK